MKTDIPGMTRRTQGFSLAELVIALGVMAVGLVMVATLFPMAIKVNNNAVRTVLGSIICENGIATAKARFSVYKTPPPGSNLTAVADDRVDRVTGANAIFIPDTDRYFPAGDEESPYGFAVAARVVDDDKDVNTFEGYQVAVTSYQRWKQDQGSEVFWAALSGNKLIPDVDTATLTYYNNGGKMQKGSPVINARNGKFTTILQVQTNPGTTTVPGNQYAQLREGLDLGTPDTARRVLTLAEEYTNKAGVKTLTAFSPAMATMVSRFGLVKLDVEVAGN